MKKYRKKIDKINDKILKLLKKRMKLVGEIGKYKKKNNIKVIDKNREREIFSDLERKAKKYNLDAKYVRDVFKIIIKNSRKAQR